jgi:Na+-transporting NADH:ubiquinone oxidoreductase subunit NqrC
MKDEQESMAAFLLVVLWVILIICSLLVASSYGVMKT